jgi:type IV secretory pathway VirB10-like protein
MADESQISPPETQPAPPSENASSLRDKRIRPEGVVPKQAQGYVVAALAVLILMAVMFSKNHAKSATTASTPAPIAVSTDMNQRKIQELEQELSADQRQGQRAMAQKAIGNSPTVPNGTPASVQTNGAVMTPAAAVAQLPPPTEPPRDPVADAERAMALKARFASNLVSAEDNASRPLAEPSGTSENTAAHSQSAPQAAVTQPSSATDKKRTPEVNVNSAQGRPYVVFEGTTIDTVVVNRLDGEFAGPLKVMVTNPIYSQDRQHLLIPEGTFILGDVQKVAGLGQKRLAVTFHRLLMPDGYSADLDQFHGLDQAGSTGLRDKVNNHYVEIFGASIALGVIAGAAEATNLNQGYDESGSEAYKAGIASSLSQSNTNVLDRFINIPTTITIREGHRIKVYITQDMLLPAYENHTIPANF